MKQRDYVIRGVCQGVSVRQPEHHDERMRRGGRGRETSRPLRYSGQDRGNSLVSPAFSLASRLHSIWLGLRTNVSL
jgi:hypothetical protein